MASIHDKLLPMNFILLSEMRNEYHKQQIEFIAKKFKKRKQQDSNQTTAVGRRMQLALESRNKYVPRLSNAATETQLSL